MRADGEDPWRTVTVPAGRLAGWIERFAARHGEPTWRSGDGSVEIAAPDGAVARIGLPGGSPTEPDATAVVATAAAFDRFGLVLVRRGGFAIGRVEAGQLVRSRCGTRYVQGQTKAGGQSQKRFARRRANQAMGLVREAAVVVDDVIAGEPLPVVGGGDRALVRQVLDAARADLADRVVDRWLDVGNPRRRVLEESVAAARAARIDLNARA